MERKMGQKAKGSNLKPVAGRRNKHENARFSEEFHMLSTMFGYQHKAMDIPGC